jgi:hypothetical protein
VRKKPPAGQGDFFDDPVTDFGADPMPGRTPLK